MRGSLAAKALLRFLWGAYLTALVVYALVIAIWGDRQWLATVMMFGPKWPLLLPLFLLLGMVPLASVRWRWSLLGAAACVLWVVWLADFRVGWRTLWVRAEPDVKIISCNLSGPRADTSAVLGLLLREQPDAVCFQEWDPSSRSGVPPEWHLLEFGRNVIASPWQLRLEFDVKRQHPPSRWPSSICQLVVVDKPDCPFHLAGLHLDSPRYGLGNVVDRRTLLAPSKRSTLERQLVTRRQESQQVSQAISEVDAPLLIAGDFNLPISSRIYRECWKPWQNAFSLTGWGFGYTVGVRQGGFMFYARIDHVLASDHWRCVEARVGPAVRSDHWPIIAEFALREEYRDERRKAAASPAAADAPDEPAAGEATDPTAPATAPTAAE